MSTQCFELIEEATRVYHLRVEKKTGEFFGLLCPPKDGSIYAYNRPALYIDGSLREDYTTIVIRSIDDSGLTLWFPGNNREHLDKFREFIENEVNNKFVCPERSEIEEFCKSRNGYADYW